MKAIVDRLLELGLSGGLASLVVAGAGRGTELPLWRSLRPARLVLIEPQPVLAEGLAARLRDDQGEQLVRAALVAHEQDTAILYQVNNPSASSVAEPQALLARFPNLRVDALVEVPALGLDALVDAVAAREGPDPAEDASQALLVIDAPGLAEMLLQRPEALQRFAWVALRHAADALYAGEQPLDPLLEVLVRVGFEIDTRVPDLLPMNSLVLLRRDAKAVAYGRMHRLADQLSRDNALLVQERAERTAETTRLIRALEALTDERDTLAAARDALAADRAQLLQIGESLAAEKTQLVLARDGLAADKAQLMQTRDALIAERDHLIGARDGLSQERDALRTERDALLAARDALAAEKAQLVQVRDGLAAQKTQLVQARDGLAAEFAKLTRRVTASPPRKRS